MRNLCSIQTILKLEPIPEKDKIELATILGWHVIVGKGDFQVGDHVIYVEYDTVLPEKPEFEFLRKRCYVPKWNGFRIRNMKMAGVYSEGIVFPISILPEEYRNKPVDTNVTEIIGAVKYDPEAMQENDSATRGNSKKYWWLKIPILRKLFPYKKVSGNFPSFVTKTDATRVQVLGDILEKFEGLECYTTEKLDGCSATYALHKGQFYVCSRNMRITRDNGSVYWQIANQGMKKKLNNMLRILKKDWRYKVKSIVVQGEILAPNVQGNKYKVSEPEFYVFSIYLPENDFYLSWDSICDIAGKSGMQYVPILLHSFHLVKDTDAYVRISSTDGFSRINSAIPREGIVIAALADYPYTKNQPKVGRFFQFKAINPDFLLKFGGN